jgi:acyl carrier protein
MKTFNSITTELLGIKEEDIKDELSPKDVKDWDSMNYLLFIAELEKEFSMSFTMDQVMNAKCLGDIRKIVETKK